jgi:hypothetical protein
MNKIDDGGPAFPIPYGQVMSEDGKGMSLRDYFAAAALQGALASSDRADGETYEEVRKNICRICYEYADDMLAARKEGA